MSSSRKRAIACPMLPNRGNRCVREVQFSPVRCCSFGTCERKLATIMPAVRIMVVSLYQCIGKAEYRSTKWLY